MYPAIRTAKEFWSTRKPAPIGIGEDHVTSLIVWPWDLDIFMELNNGRILTLFDIGRFGLFRRMGLLSALKSKGWYGTVAGSAIRYRKRITVFQKLELRTRVIGWDNRFTYFEQSFWRDDNCLVHAVLRTAITSGQGIVPTAEVAPALGMPAESPPLPRWIETWQDAELERPWPPEKR